LTLHDMDIYSYHEGEETLDRGFAPLLPTLPLPLIREGGQGDRLLNNHVYMALDTGINPGLYSNIASQYRVMLSC